MQLFHFFITAECCTVIISKVTAECCTLYDISCSCVFSAFFKLLLVFYIVFLPKQIVNQLRYISKNKSIIGTFTQEIFTSCNV